jgi:hypothetical protein
MKLLVAGDWAALDDHFQRHAALLKRFRHTRADAVARVWKYQINEEGVCLSQFQRDALIERHCEIFETWPT